MGRLNRVNFKAGIYFITIRGNNKENIFGEDILKIKFLELVAKYKERYNFYLLSYCIMSNHVHMLVQVNDFPTYKFMHAINSAYSKWYNAHITSTGVERTGHVFEKRYNCNLICDYNYLLEATKYTVQNPLKAYMVNDIDGYKWSSHGELVGKNNLNLADNTRLFYLIGDGNIKGGKRLYESICRVRSLYEFDDFASNKVLGKIEYYTIHKDDATDNNQNQSNTGKEIIITDELKSNRKSRVIVCIREEYVYILFKTYGQNISYIARLLNKSPSGISKMLERYMEKVKI